MGYVPAEWMPNAKAERIICHWTAGGYKASPLDRKHYHILVEDDGEIIRGYNSIADNDRTTDGVYAAHTLGLNTGSIGVAVCCMADATETPFDAGRFPMTEVQWERMAQIAAELCHRYGLPVTERTVLGHGEVQHNLGIKQKGKWDPLVLPWRSNLSRTKVGSLFRIRVLSALEEVHAASRTPEHAVAKEGTSALPVLAIMDGVALPGAVLFNEGAYIKIASMVSALEWQVADVAADSITFHDRKGISCRLPHTFLGEEDLSAGLSKAEIKRALLELGFVSALNLAKVRKIAITWDPSAESITIGSATVQDSPLPTQIVSRFAPTVITVKPGDTLYKIAEHHLGNGSRWTTLLKKDGTSFTEADAKELTIGQEIYLPHALQSQSISLPVAPTEGTTVNQALIDALIKAASPALRRYAARSVPIILSECISSNVRDPAQIAYILATSEHESNCGMHMHELGKPAYFNKYEFRRSLGNNQKGDGFRFRGRGFVQLTGRINYKKWGQKLRLDLLSDPEMVASDAIAAKILVQGMIAGSFTGKALPNYVQGSVHNFYDARAVINGDKAKNGNRIAEHAKRYLAACTDTTAKGALEDLRVPPLTAKGSEIRLGG